MLEEETVDGFLRGFENFRLQMARFCPQVDLSTVRPRMNLGYGSDTEDLPAILTSEAGLYEQDPAEPSTRAAETEGVPEAAPAAETDDVPEAAPEAPAPDPEPVPAENLEIINVPDDPPDVAPAA